MSTNLRNTSLLSFGDEIDEDEEQIVQFNKQFKDRSEKKLKEKSAPRHVLQKKKPEMKQEEEKEQHRPPPQPEPDVIELVDDDAEVGRKAEEATKLKSAFPSAFAGIPDARAVYEARKKREMMRQVGQANGGAGAGGGEFIPLDDTVRLKSEASSGERARLVREDENDMSDEEEGNSFYSAKKLLQNEEQRRRDELAYFLELEQGGEDEEEVEAVSLEEQRRRREEAEEAEEEESNWESAQIRKGVSASKVLQMQDELNATSLHFRGHKYFLDARGGPAAAPLDVGEAEMDLEMDVEVLEGGARAGAQLQAVPAVAGTLLGRPMPPIEGRATTSLEDILAGLQQRMGDKRQQQGTAEAELARLQGHVRENTELIHKLERTVPDQERRFRMLQDVRMYVRDLLDCLNEKIGQINGLEERVMEMWTQRRKGLVARRRQDVQDQYERCKASSTDRPFVVPNPEFAQREAEREARRSRRRLQRSTAAAGQPHHQQLPHFEGLSSDEEETPSREVHYRDTLAAAQAGASDVFLDTEEDFCAPGRVLAHLLAWLVVDERSFEEAYVPLCLPKLLGPFVRLQQLGWQPLKDPASALQSQPWYAALLTAGLDNSGLGNLEHPVLVELVPAVMDKIVLAKIARVVRDQWDPLSLNESSTLATLLQTLVHDYPLINADSKRMREVLSQVHAKIRDSLEHDTFVPLYSKEAIENVETGCGAFLDRQFWRAIKLMRSILCFRALLSDASLEELLVEGLVNRCAVMALQFSVLASPATVHKCRALIQLIPSDWLPSRRPASYRPLAMLLKQAADVHQQRDRKFAQEARKFADLALATSAAVKQEEEGDEEEEGNGDE